MLLQPARGMCWILRMLKRLLVLMALAFAGVSCKDAPPPVPASSDPDGKDLVEGAVVAATEAAGGIRLYKIVHVDDYPDPIGYQIHMIAYEEKASTFPEAAAMWKKGEMKVALNWMVVAMALFIKRDHRVLVVEKVTEAEMAPYLHAKNSRHQ
jgi:hypothetical protein